MVVAAVADSVRAPHLPAAGLEVHAADFLAVAELPAHEDVRDAVFVAVGDVGKGFAGRAGAFAVGVVGDFDDEDFVLDPEGVDSCGGQSGVDAWWENWDGYGNGEFTVCEDGGWSSRVILVVVTVRVAGSIQERPIVISFKGFLGLSKQLSDGILNLGPLFEGAASK